MHKPRSLFGPRATLDVNAFHFGPMNKREERGSREISKAFVRSAQVVCLVAPTVDHQFFKIPNFVGPTSVVVP